MGILQQLSIAVDQNHDAEEIQMSPEFAQRFIEALRPILEPYGVKITFDRLWSFEYRGKKIKVTDYFRGETFVLR